MTTDVNNEQERAAFEWWASDEGESPQAEERVGECYKLAQIQSYWMAWQARAALQSPEIQALRKDAGRLKLRLETLRQLYPNAPSDEELDAAIDAAMEKRND